MAQIDALTEGAAFVVGHNVIRHDLPALATLFPGLKLNALPAVDTLELSPLAFPENPYHSLLKDYKLVRDSRNDPLKDAQLSFRLWSDQRDAKFPEPGHKRNCTPFPRERCWQHPCDRL